MWNMIRILSLYRKLILKKNKERICDLFKRFFFDKQCDNKKYGSDKNSFFVKEMNFDKRILKFYLYIICFFESFHTLCFHSVALSIYIKKTYWNDDFVDKNFVEINFIWNRY